MGITAINHLAFITPDLPGTIRFYRDLLGMQLHAGIGHDGYRHYFFQFGDNQVAFFEYEGAGTLDKKFPGVKTDKPLGFDHVSFTVDTCEELLAYKDKLEAAGLEVHGVVDHGVIWSIYFYDNNNLPLEISWDCMEVLETPAVVDSHPLDIVAEGSDPQPGHWPEPTTRTRPEDCVISDGNAYELRAGLIEQGKARMTDDLRRILAATEAAKATGAE